AVAGCFGVPVLFLSGDNNACADAKSFLPWVQTVEVKEAIGRYAAASLSPADACAAIKVGIERSLRAASSSGAKPYALSPPIALELCFTRTSKADMASLLPGSERIDGRTLRFVHDDFLTVFKAFRAMTALGGCD
ncbi:MAG: M55 family metallopeptidase, partial [Candidatus Eremiobacteraeota bacterium]|nr:M55 family metallopeptidase [Candidatus Eremiobacteraeota bacterium]